MKTTDIISAKLNELFCKMKDVEFAYVFGSYARGDVFPLSDIDVAVYTDQKDMSLDYELKMHSILSKELKSNTVDLIVLNKTRNLMLLDEIIRYGRVVYDRNPSLREDFELRILHDAMDFRYQRKVFAGR